VLKQSAERGLPHDRGAGLGGLALLSGEPEQALMREISRWPEAYLLSCELKIQKI
jgi:hypothetical protein